MMTGIIISLQLIIIRKDFTEFSLITFLQPFIFFS